MTITTEIRRLIEEHRATRWGWDGDCGTDRIIDRIEEECDKIENRRLTNDEREDIYTAALACEDIGFITLPTKLRNIVQRLK